MALLHTSSHLLGSPPPAPPAPLYSSRPLTVPPPERAAPHTFPSEASPHASGLSSNPPAPREAFPGLPSLRHFTRFYSHHPHRDLKLFSLRTSLPVSLALKYKFGEAKNPLVLFTAVSPRASNGSLGAQYVEGTDAPTPHSPGAGEDLTARGCRAGEGPRTFRLCQDEVPITAGLTIPTTSREAAWTGARACRPQSEWSPHNSVAFWPSASDRTSLSHGFLTCTRDDNNSTNSSAPGLHKTIHGTCSEEPQRTLRPP